MVEARLPRLLQIQGQITDDLFTAPVVPSCFLTIDLWMIVPDREGSALGSLRSSES